MNRKMVILLQELHAHLNGSLSFRTLKKLYELQTPDGLEFQKYKDSLTGYGEYDITFELFI